MNVDPMRQTLGLHVIINPMVGWIWIATGLMGVGALITLFQGRSSTVEFTARMASAASSTTSIGGVKPRTGEST